MSEPLTKKEHEGFTFDEVRYAIHNRLDNCERKEREFIDESVSQLISLVRSYEATVQDLEKRLAEEGVS